MHVVAYLNCIIYIIYYVHIYDMILYKYLFRCICYLFKYTSHILYIITYYTNTCCRLPQVLLLLLSALYIHRLFSFYILYITYIISIIHIIYYNLCRTSSCLDNTCCLYRSCCTCLHYNTIYYIALYYIS